MGPPVTASTPKSAKQSAAANSQTTSKSPVDHEAVRGERLSNYGQGTLLVGRRACPPAVPSANAPTRPGVDGGSRLLTGRRSVDSAMCRNVAVARGGYDGIGELGAQDFTSSSYGYAPARRRCITPVNEAAAPTDASSLFAGYQLRRPQLQPTPTSAVSDSESPSYYSSASGRRSLPRIGRVLPQAYPPAFHHADSSSALPQSVAAASSASAGPCWPPSSTGSRPQSSATSTISGSAENMRKNLRLLAVLQCQCQCQY